LCAAAVACSASARESTLPPMPACGWVLVDQALDRGAMRHSADDAVAALGLGSTARVVRVDAVRAALPIASKLGLPRGSRRLWLVYTAEPTTPDTGAAGPSTTAESRVLRVVDDETLQPAGATACP
jgi:hypothetical protein